MALLRTLVLASRGALCGLLKGLGAEMAAAFQGNAFQVDAFQVGQAVVSTSLIPLPVDYYMVGLPQFADAPAPLNPGRRGRIRGPAPSFTVKTTKRGYD